MHRLIGRGALIDRCKSPKQIKSDEAGEDTRHVWDLECKQTEKKGIMGDVFYLNRETVLKAVFTGVTVALSLTTIK